MAEGRDQGILAGIEDDQEAVAFGEQRVAHVDIDGEIAGDEMAKMLPVKISVELEHRPIEVEDFLLPFRAIVIEALLIGIDALIGGFAEIVVGQRLDGVRQVDLLGIAGERLGIGGFEPREEAPRIIEGLFLHIGVFYAIMV